MLESMWGVEAALAGLHDWPVASCIDVDRAAENLQSVRTLSECVVIAAPGFYEVPAHAGKHG